MSELIATVPPPENLPVIHRLGVEVEALREQIVKAGTEVTAARKALKKAETREQDLMTERKNKQEQISTLARGGHIEELFGGVPTKIPIEQFDALEIDVAMCGGKVPANTIAALKEHGFKTGGDVRKWITNQDKRKVAGVSAPMKKMISAHVEAWLSDRTRAAGDPPVLSPAAEETPPINGHAIVEDGLKEMAERGKPPEDDNLTGEARAQLMRELDDALDNRLQLAGHAACAATRADLLAGVLDPNDPKPDRMMPAEHAALIGRINALSNKAVKKLLIGKPAEA